MNNDHYIGGAFPLPAHLRPDWTAAKEEELKAAVARRQESEWYKATEARFSAYVARKRGA